MPKPERLKIDCDNLHSKRGARLLAEAITEYWLSRGHLVSAESYPLDDTPTPHWGVRSNLVNGLPPKHLALRS
jgi:hypothetical protein